MKILTKNDFSSLNHGDVLESTYRMDDTMMTEHFMILKCVYENDFILTITSCDSKGNRPFSGHLEVFGEKDFLLMLLDVQEAEGELKLLDLPYKDIDLLETSESVFKDLKKEFDR